MKQIYWVRSQTQSLLIALNASASSDTKNQQIAERLKQLVSLPPISQEQLDSLSDRLVYLNNLNSEMSDDVCHEIALLKTEIAHGCMNGGRTVHITGILNDPSSCTPHHGLYDLMLGNIAAHPSSTCSNRRPALKV